MIGSLRGGILSSGKDFFSHQWDEINFSPVGKKIHPIGKKKIFPTGENLYKKKFSPVGRKWRKGEERGGRGRKGPTSNAFRLGLWLKRMDMRPKARIKPFTLYFELHRGRYKRGKHKYININL